MKCPDAAANVIALVLAAGRGRRFGSDKRQAKLHSGQGLLATTVALAQRNFAEVYVALREEDDPSRLGLSPSVQVVRCADADLGMGHSLAAAMRVLSAQHGEARAVAVLLGDMPWITDHSLQTLKQAASAGQIVFPVYEHTRGHPVIIGRQYWPEMCALQGDQGAKLILQTHAQACTKLALDDPGVLRDVDSPDALREFL